MTTTAPEPTITLETPAAKLRQWAETAPDQVALREKNRGIWREITWRQYWESASHFAHALLSRGIEPGDRVAIHSENRPEWMYTDLGTVAARAICLGLYPTNPSAEVEYLLQNSGARILVVEDQEQADKVLAIPAERLPELDLVVFIERRGVDVYDDPRLVGWDEFLAEGRAHAEAHPRALDERMAAAEPDDIAYLIYTSGTTGPPKGVMLSVENTAWAGKLLGSPGGLVDPPPNQDDMTISYLPLCHVYEKALNVWLAMWYGHVVHFGESIDTLTVDMRDVQPTIFPAVPRIWERLHAAAEVRLASASPLKKINAGIWLKAAGYIGNTLARTGGKHTVVSRVLLALGEVFLFRALKERLGLRRVRHGVSGAAPIAPEIIQFFLGIGVPLFEGYGMSENCAVATTNGPGSLKLGTVGKPYPQIELKLDDDTNEILVRHPAVFEGYWRNEEATRETLDEDGWLHTGDVGEWDGEFLKIVDRVKDIIITSGGKNISPSEIENSLKTSPFIKEAIVIGDRRKYLTALIGIEFDVTSEWAQRKKLPHTTYRDLSEKPEVVALVQRAVDETNEKFSRVEGIKYFRLLTKELDHEDGELTATQKVKRKVIEERFADEIESMY
ncbi:MAG: long-chain fatty acid--CoA ligase [Acidimicrobiia bacterium]|nr:long-chain fatty acid--CoA ligase [Acidimicrobiia bacterium]